MRKLISAVLILLIISFIKSFDFEKVESVDNTVYNLTGPNFSLSLTVDKESTHGQNFTAQNNGSQCH